MYTYVFKSSWNGPLIPVWLYEIYFRFVETMNYKIYKIFIKPVNHKHCSLVWAAWSQNVWNMQSAGYKRPWLQERGPNPTVCWWLHFLKIWSHLSRPMTGMEIVLLVPSLWTASYCQRCKHCHICVGQCRGMVVIEPWCQVCELFHLKLR